MSTTTVESSAVGRAAPVARERAVPEPIPTSRLLAVELRKMFDTRAGFWMLVSIGVGAALATAAVIAFAPDAELDYETFGTAVGVPMSIVLPIIAILSVTSEWSQRTGLSTFTLVPHRGRVVGAKLVCAVLVGVVAMPVAMGVGALGNLLGATITGIDPVWNLEASSIALIVLASVLGMLMGFMLGVLFRSSAAAVVGYFVYSLVIPGLLGTLAAFQEWFADLQPWVDLTYAMTPLYDDVPTAEQWAQLGVAGLIWLVVPLAIGLWLVRRSEIK